MPMELHAVHFKSDYETQEIALRKEDGITILVYFFQVRKKAFERKERMKERLQLI